MRLSSSRTNSPPFHFPPVQEALVRVAFAAHPTCHDVNHSTASHEHLDLIIGFQTGDLIWFGESMSLCDQNHLTFAILMTVDPIALRYGRLNKQVKLFAGGYIQILMKWIRNRRVVSPTHPALPYDGCHPHQTSSSFHTQTALSSFTTRTAKMECLRHKPQPRPWHLLHAP